MTDKIPQPASAKSEGARKILESHDLFGRLSRDEMDEFIARAQTRNYPAGHMLFSKGDPGDSLFTILSGQVRISVLSEAGKEVILNILGSGEIFGEIALLDGNARTASASTIGDCELVTISRQDFLSFLARHPQVNQRLLEVLCARLRWVSTSYEDLLFLRLPHRLARKVLFLAENFGESDQGAIRTSVPLSQQELANMTGATRESINKLMRQWERGGIVAYKEGHISILDLRELSRIAESNEREK
jgi:CRP/FNR family cyclic AMP-dependent transcriptional regulator